MRDHYRCWKSHGIFDERPHKLHTWCGSISRCSEALQNCRGGLHVDIKQPEISSALHDIALNLVATIRSCASNVSSFVTARGSTRSRDISTKNSFSSENLCCDGTHPRVFSIGFMHTRSNRMYGASISSALLNRSDRRIACAFELCVCTVFQILQVCLTAVEQCMRGREGIKRARFRPRNSKPTRASHHITCVIVVTKCKLWQCSGLDTSSTDVRLLLSPESQDTSCCYF
jgi:hypothetical protein